MKRSNTLSGMMKRRALRSAAGLAFILITSTANAAGWHFSFTPYAWLTNIDVDAKLDGKQVIDEHISVSDLLEDLNTIFQGRIEVQHGELGAMVDLFDVSLSDEVKDAVLPHNTGSADLTSDVGMTLLDIAGVYDPKGDHQGIAFVSGVRLLNERATVDASFDLTGGQNAQESYETDKWLTDGLLGLRFTKRISRHFSYQMQADISTGGTDYTWSAGPSLSYAFGKMNCFGVTAGYRRMVIDFDDEEGFDPQMTMSGPLVSFRMSL